jgi:hypothetical protein
MLNLDLEWREKGLIKDKEVMKKRFCIMGVNTLKYALN